MASFPGCILDPQNTLPAGLPPLFRSDRIQKLPISRERLRQRLRMLSQDDAFKIAAVYPWVPQARLHLEAGEVLALDRFLKNVLWDHLDRTIPPYDFGLPSVISYRMKWDMVAQQLTHDDLKAGERFEELLKEITDGQPKLFH